MTPPPDAIESRQEGAVAAILLAALAVLRLLLGWTPDRFFDVDPASVPGPFPAGGPGLSLLVDALILGIAGLVLVRRVRRGSGLDPWLVVPALVPLVVVLWHARADALQAWRGVDWFAAVMLGVALAHLVPSPSSRRAVIAIVLGGIAAMGVRGGWQVFVEHADTVAYFEANRAEILASRGWQPDSAAALAFERRLRQPEATGWIGFSNVFSGLAAAGAVLLIGGLAAWRAARPKGSEAGGPVLVGIAGVGLAVLVGLNGSKGAIAAAMIGVLVLGLVLNFGGDGSRGLSTRRLGMIVVGAGLLAMLGVVVRGVMPEDLLGDRSLLFRWHYLQGAGAALASHPIAGVGPDGFQDAYLLHRPERSPEAVASAHGMVADWVASLGILGLAWVVLVAAMLVRGRDAASPEDASPSRFRPLGLAVAIGAVVLVAQAIVERPLEPEALVVRFAAVAIGGLVGLVVHQVFGLLDARSIRRVAFAAAAIILVQGQIEMLFWQPGAVAVCWALVAVAGGAAPSRWRGAEIAGPLVIGTAVIAVALGSSLLRDSGRVADAIAPLHGAIARDGTVAADRRLGVVEALPMPGEDETWWDDRVVRGAVDLLMATGTDDGVRQAAALTGAWTGRRPGPVSWAIRSSVLREAARRGLVASEEALAALDAAISFDPCDPRRRLERAELLATLGRCGEGLAAADEAVRLDAEHDLDPLVQFGDRDLGRIAAVRERCASDQSARP